MLMSYTCDIVIRCALILCVFIESVLSLEAVKASDIVERVYPAGSAEKWRFDNTYKNKSFQSAPSGVNSRDTADVRHHLNPNPRIYRRPNATATTAIPTAKPLVDQAAKKFIQWFDDSMTYGLNSTYDYRFKLRHAPIPVAGSPWPMPWSYMPSNISHRVDASSLVLEALGNSCPMLHTNFKRIKRNMFGACDKPDEKPLFRFTGGAFVNTLSVTVLKHCTKYPHLEMDESYDLVVKSSGVFIVSQEVWGALRGMETFSQLVYQDTLGQYWINEAVIHDYPRFKHRGLLLDTARHYLRKEVIIDNLEAMAQNKLNVFHWHIVDDQSFPYQSKVFPDLTKMGSYDPDELIYTHEDIAEIIEEARVRGIRVIPEFDTPGHTFSWGFAQKHLLTPCYDYRGRPNGRYGPVNPTLKKNYRFMKTLFQEVMSVFKDKYIHLGGDEVPFDCWLSNPFIQKFMKRNRVTDIRKVLNLYERELLKAVSEIGVGRKGGSGYIVWQEVFDNDVKLNPDAIVQVWSGDAYSVERVTNAGMKAIFSTCWYLDYINYGQDWDKYYRCDQLSYRTLNETLFIGGEVCMWTEYADNDEITPRIWPRASAAAERLWSDHRVTDVHEASGRIEAQRCRMIRTGLKVGVLSGPGHCPMNSRKNRAATKCNDPTAASSHQEVSVQSSLPFVVSTLALIIAIVIAILLVIPAQRRRLVSVIVHTVSNGKLQQKFIYVLVASLGMWLLWWLMRSTWLYHPPVSPSS